MNDLNVDVIYALSPQAKGKIERPYRWLQDRIVRTCTREKITTIEEAQKVLEKEVERYNYHQVHSTTREILIIRFKKAVEEKRSLFRELIIPSPYQSTKDIFCLRLKRTVDAYHKIFLNNIKLRVHQVPLRDQVELCIVPDEKTGISEVRIWYKDTLTDVYHIKNSDLNIVKF